MTPAAGKPGRTGPARIVRMGVLACALATLAAGCLSVQPAALETAAPSGASRVAPVAPAADAEPIWPARWGDASGSKGVVVPLVDREVRYTGRRIGRFHDQLPTLREESLLRRLAEDRATAAGYRYRLEGPGSYIFTPVLRAGDARDLLPESRRPLHRLVFVSGEVAETAEVRPGEPEDRVVIHRTWAEFHTHRDQDIADEPGRGTVVVAPGLFGVPDPVISGIVQAIRNDGWNVLRFLAPPSRFTERAEIDMIRVNRIPEDQGGGFTVDYNVEQFAEHSSDRVAEYAYATEAMLRWLRDRHPERFTGPSPLIAMSAGAMSGPAIISRAPDLYGPTLLIAGGGDLLSVTTRSSYTPLIDAVRLDWGFDTQDDDAPAGATGDAIDAILAAITDDYLAVAPLDPLNLAPRLEGRPIVMLHGTRDTAVPAADGDRLWHALGQPERWLTPLDHGPLFVGLFLWTPRILDWLNTQPADTPGPIPSAPTEPYNTPAP